MLIVVLRQTERLLINTNNNVKGRRKHAHRAGTCYTMAWPHSSSVRRENPPLHGDCPYTESTLAWRWSVQRIHPCMAMVRTDNESTLTWRNTVRATNRFWENNIVLTWNHFPPIFPLPLPPCPASSTGWRYSSVGRASDRHAADAGSIPRCSEGFFS